MTWLVVLSGRRTEKNAIRSRAWQALIDRSPIPVHAPPPILCTDNGAMIAACAHHRFDALRAGLDLDPQPGMRFAVAT